MKRGEPVTFVRSPIMTKGARSPTMRKGSRPERRVAGGTCGMVRGFCPATAFAISAMCSGVEPQQPPTMFSQPCLTKPPRIQAMWSGLSS